MNHVRLCVVLLPALLLLAPATDLQAQTVYRHPELGFQFEASEGWTRVAHPEDRLIYHMQAPGNRLHVMLWYTETEQEAAAYLTKMADMKGYQALTEPRPEELRQVPAMVLQAVGVTDAGDLRVILAAMRSGEGLFITQIWCPLERYEEDREEMESILESVEVGP